MHESEPLEPLGPDVLALLTAAKPVAALESARKKAIFTAVTARTGMPLGSNEGGSNDGGSNDGGSNDGGSNDGGSNDGGAGEGAAGTGVSGAGAGAAGAASSVVTAFTSAKGLAVVMGTFLAGLATGVVVDQAVARHPAEVLAGPIAPTSVRRPSRVEDEGLEGATGLAEIPSVAAGSLPEAVPPTAPAAAAHGPTPTGAATSTMPSSRGLAAERALLDVARSALARGESAEALVAAERHGRAYPDGALVEEREAIAIKALVALGRGEEARTRAVLFERRFPHGLMLRAVKGAAFGPP